MVENQSAPLQPEVMQTWQILCSSAISIAQNLLSWTTSLAALLSFPAGTSQLQCPRIAFLQTQHEIYFLLCFCCTPCPLALKLDSITWRTQSTSPPLSMALSERHQVVTLMVSQFSVLCSSFHRPPTKQVSSFSIHPQMLPHSLN